MRGRVEREERDRDKYRESVCERERKETAFV